MVGVDNQKDVQRMDEERIHIVGFRLAREHHVEEVRAVALFRVGINERFADACLVRECGDGAHL